MRRKIAHVAWALVPPPGDARPSVRFGGTSAIVVHEQGHVIVSSSIGGPEAGGFAVSADGHGHVELRNSAVISPTSALGFAITSDSGGNSTF